jgi:hypothetical protein
MGHPFCFLLLGVNGLEVSEEEVVVVVVNPQETQN